MNDYEISIGVMTQIFHNEHQFTLSTMGKLLPSVRFADVIYYDNSFYVITLNTSKKIRDIENDPFVSLNNNIYTFTCSAVNLGHPLANENEHIRKVLMERFSNYEKRCDEKNPASCFLKITPQQGFFHFGGLGYDVNFSNKTAKIFPFDIQTLTHAQTTNYPY